MLDVGHGIPECCYVAAETPDARAALDAEYWAYLFSGAADDQRSAGLTAPHVIDTLIAAVRAGELDELFSQAAKSGTIGKARKAA